MLTNTRAIVLNSIKYGDKKIIVSTFSEEFGIITFSYSTTKRPGKTNLTNLLQPLNIVEIEFDKKPTAQIHPVKTVRIDIPSTTIHFDTYKLSISLFLAEFLRFALNGEQANKNLFDYISSSIQWLDAAQQHYSNFHIVFMIKISHFLGFYPNTENYHSGVWFDMQNGEFATSMPLHKQVLRPEEARIIPILGRLTYSTMHLLKLTHHERNLCTENILKYYQIHIPEFPDLRSFPVLKELFA